MWGILKKFCLFRNFFTRGRRQLISFAELFSRFQAILNKNNQAMEIIADMGSKLGGEFVFDKKYLSDRIRQITEMARASAYDLNYISGNRYLEIYEVAENLTKELQTELSGKIVVHQQHNIRRLDEIHENMDDLAGNKAYNLSRVAHLPMIRVPQGFVVTIGGFRSYLAYNNLFDKIEGLIDDCMRGNKSIRAVDQAINLMILGGDIPPDLRRDILHAAEGFCGGNPDQCYFAVRSSALGEDGELSFAGLHRTFLNMPLRELLSSYKKVLASLYNEASLAYRLNNRLLPMEMAMPVLFQLMVPSRVAGALLTLDPNAPDRQECLVSANWGLGNLVVDGTGSVDEYRVSRDPPHEILEQRVGARSLMSKPVEPAGPAPALQVDLGDTPCLNPGEISAVVEVAMILERFFKRPLEVEWTLDEQGQVWLLQARPLTISKASRARGPELKDILQKQQVLLSERGAIVYRGIGAGPVWIVDSDDELDRVPSGAVLVSHFSPAWLAKGISRASAVITDVGSAASHMATVAREFRVPTIVDTAEATQMLTPGDEVTVDAERNVVYKGRIAELLHHQLLETASFEGAYEFQLLRRLLRKIAPLSLIDPQGSSFAAENCQTFHDLIRFIHEKAVETLAEVGRDPRTFLKRGGKRLKSHIPLDLILIDIGGGLAESTGKDGYVQPEQIRSTPMAALWHGLSQPDVWSTEPMPVDFKGLMSSLTRTQTAEVPGTTLTGVNLAVIGSNYLNLSLRVGYHFNVVDASMGPTPEDNHIYFRFIGGVTDLSRRSRRATLLMSVFEKIGFKVEVKGDLVIARTAKITEAQMKSKLCIIGRLIGFARQLDVVMKNDADRDIYLEKFMGDIKPLSCNL
jgi:pyruvate,water dikinase